MSIRGFAIRDLAGIKIHGQSLEAQGFDITDLIGSSTDDLQEVWDRVVSIILPSLTSFIYALKSMTFSLLR